MLSLTNFSTVGKWVLGPAKATKDLVAFDSTSAPFREVSVKLAAAKRVLGRNRPEPKTVVDTLRPLPLHKDAEEVVEVRLAVASTGEQVPDWDALATMGLRLEITAQSA